MEMRAFSCIFRKMHTFSSNLHKIAFSVKMHFQENAHFHLICIKCAHFQKMRAEIAKNKFSEIGLSPSKVFLSKDNHRPTLILYFKLK